VPMLNVFGKTRSVVFLIAAILAIASFGLSPQMAVHAMQMDGQGDMGCMDAGCVDGAPMDQMADCADHCLQMQEERSELIVVDTSSTPVVREVDRDVINSFVESTPPVRGSPKIEQRSRHLSVQKKE